MRVEVEYTVKVHGALATNLECFQRSFLPEDICCSVDPCSLPFDALSHLMLWLVGWAFTAVSLLVPFVQLVCAGHSYLQSFLRLTTVHLGILQVTWYMTVFFLSSGIVFFILSSGFRVFWGLRMARGCKTAVTLSSAQVFSSLSLRLWM